MARNPIGMGRSDRKRLVKASSGGTKVMTGRPSKPRKATAKRTAAPTRRRGRS